MSIPDQKEPKPADLHEVARDVEKLKAKKKDDPGLLTQSNQSIEFLTITIQSVCALALAVAVIFSPLMTSDPVLSKGIIVGCTSLLGIGGLEGTLLSLHRNRKMNPEKTDAVPLSSIEGGIDVEAVSAGDIS